MGRFWLAGAVAAGVLLASPPPGLAQRRIQRVYTTADGLAHSTVLSMAEDGDGFLWLGTSDGVSRIDGTELTRFPAGDAGPSGAVFAVRPAPDGSLWMGTPRGIHRFRHGHFSLLPPALGLNGRWIQELAAAPGGRLLLAAGGRLLTVSAADAIASQPLPAATFANRDVVALLAARDGTIYLGPARGGGFALRAGTVRPVAGLPGETVFDLCETRDGTIVWGTNAGAALLRPGEERAVPVPWIRERINAIAQAEDGTVLLGSGGSGVLFARLEAAAARPAGALTIADGLPSNDVHSLYIARGKTLYIGTARGLAVSRPGPAASWSDGIGGLPRGEVAALAQGRDGTIWAGTEEGLFLLRDGGWRRPRHDALGPRAVTAIAASASGILYAGTRSGHLAAVDGEEVRLVGPSRGLDSGEVWALHSTPRGELFVSTTRTLFTLRQGRLERWADLRQPALSLASAADGALYVGSISGLVAVGAGIQQTWTPREGLAGDTVRALHFGRDGALYAGTARGLSIRRSGRFTTFDHRLGLSNDNVQCLVEDEAGRLYVATNQGVDVLALLNGASRPRVVRTLTRADGLAGGEIRRGACLEDHQGRIWLGSADGVSVYDPRLDSRPPAPPPVRILGIQRAGEDVELPTSGEVLRLGAGGHRLAVSFAAVDLQRPWSGPYAYRWLGLDPAWVETDQRVVQIAHLPPGRYRFEVRAGGAGPRGPAAAFAFEIPAPVWRRPWFLALALSALAGAAFLVTAHLRGLLALERLRSAIAANLHDHLGAGLCEISLLADLAERGGSPAHPGAGFPRITALAVELAAELDDIVWLVHPRRDSLEELVLRLKDRFAEIASCRDIEFTASGLAACAGLRLPMARREGLHALFREAFHNALRHSGCRTIELAVRLAGRRLEISLRDDGRGFDPAAPERGDGLANMRRRAAALGGELTVRSAPGAGTEITFTGPVGERRPRLPARLGRRRPASGGPP